MDATRRKLLATAGVAALLGGGMSGLSKCTSTDWVKSVADFVQLIQQKVSDAIKTACSTAQAWIVVPDTILAIAAKVLNVTSIVTGNLGEALAAAQKVVDAIVAAGCPAPAAAPVLGAAFQGTPVVFFR